jgi:hypothetical protein
VLVPATEIEKAIISLKKYFIVHSEFPILSTISSASKEKITPVDQHKKLLIQPQNVAVLSLRKDCWEGCEAQLLKLLLFRDLDEQ